LAPEDWAANDRSLADGERLLSSGLSYAGNNVVHRTITLNLLPLILILGSIAISLRSHRHRRMEDRPTNTKRGVGKTQALAGLTFSLLSKIISES
jgi:hypothetical protein